MNRVCLKNLTLSAICCLVFSVSLKAQSLENALFSGGSLSVANSEFILGQGLDTRRSVGNYSTVVSQGSALNSCQVDGGQLSLLGPTDYCSNENSVVFDIEVSNDQGDNFVWGITPLTSTNVLGISFSGPQFNISQLDGDYRIWHMRYRDDVILSGISDATELEGCYDLANPIIISVQDCPQSQEIPIEIFPNPAKETVYVSFDFEKVDVEGKTAVRIFDLSGRLVVSQIHPTSSIKHLQIDVSPLTPGMYMLEAQNSLARGTTVLMIN